MADSWPASRLVEAAQRGDTESLSALLAGSHPHVRRFAHSLCASPEDAEEAAQEALIILYRKIGTLRSTAALTSWVFRIVRNECLRLARLLQHDDVVPDGVTPSAEDEAMQRLDAERIAAAIAALPADQRQVLIMRDVQGYSGRMVADTLGLSTAAMKSRLHRARTAVRDLLLAPPDERRPVAGDQPTRDPALRFLP